MVTLYPAMNLGIADRVGSLEVGKDGDVSIFSHYPLHTRARCEMTIIEGEVFFDRSQTDVAATWVEGFSGGMESAAGTSYPLLDPRQGVVDANTEVPTGDDWAITGGTVVTVTGEVIENGTVVVEDGIITAVGRNVAVPQGVERFDASGRFVYPGLIDAGTGLGLQEAGGMAGPVDNFELGPYNPHIEAYIGVHQHSEILGCQRVGGFTTVVTGLSGQGAPIPGWDSLINLWGYTTKAMAVEERIGLRVNWAGGGGRRGPQAGAASRSGDRADDLKAYFLEAKAYAARAEMAARGEIDDFEWDIRLEGLAPAASGQLPVFIEANSEEDIKDAVAFAEELDLKYVIRGGQEAWKITDFLTEHDVKLLFRGIHSTPGRDEPYDIHYATPAILEEAGVDFAIYSGGTSNVFSLTYEAGMAVAFGLPMEKALRCLTIDAARILGVNDRLGSIEEGKIANLLITTGNPVEYTSQVHTMFIGGQRVPWDDKFSRLWHKFGSRPDDFMP
jgi:imidazolonepropionase-like amidohydrolase